MQAGRVVASGTHAELLAPDADYAAMLSAYDTAVPSDYDDD
jgi:ABC-type transport system involved in Fe-S cluster assembly fused permease/ATPase subunit